MISEEQIQDLIDSNERYSKEYFVWQMDEDNTNIEQFYLDEIEYDLEEQVLALMQETGDFYSDCETAINNDEWLVLTDDEAFERSREYAESYVDDALSEIPRYLYTYFDTEQYIDDILDEGRGSALASYDGEERDQKVNNTIYYLYKC